MEDGKNFDIISTNNCTDYKIGNVKSAKTITIKFGKETAILIFDKNNKFISAVFYRTTGLSIDSAV